MKPAVTPVATEGVKPGTKLGDYDVQKLLGSGGMGEVFRARDTRLGRDVAIKVLPVFFSRDPDRLRRFEQEARAAAALNHPNILAVFQMGTHEGAPFLVSELLEGSSLREALIHGPLPVRKVIDYGVQIARGLAAAHEKGIVHRDLKPENLFVTSEGHVKILDFGLAKLTYTAPSSGQFAPTSTGTDPGLVVGTAGYMSPEQVRGEPADHRSDIFALGCVLFEMLTGRRAFQRPTPAETLSAILNDEPPSISQLIQNIPPALQRVVHRCLEKSPGERLQSSSDLAFALEALSDSESSSIPATNGISRAWISALGATAILIFVVLVWWWRQPPPLPRLEGAIQLTHDSRPKASLGSLASDGSRLYFTERIGGVLTVAQVSVTGGETVPLASGLVNPAVLDIAPDSSALLISYGTQDNYHLATLPVLGGQLRTIARAERGAFSPDGRLITYCSGSALYIAQPDGSNPHKIADVGCAGPFFFAPSISPDGKTVRLAVTDPAGHPLFWDIHTDGSGAARLDPTVPGSGGKWSPDGRFFVFECNENLRMDLCLRLEKHGVFSRAQEPIRFTNGPLSFDAPLPSRDGKNIYAIGYQNRGELVRYDSASKQFLPVLDGISATDLAYSADGKWLIYLSYPTHELWRSRADGSDRLQLTYLPMLVFWPRISPDGKQVQFLAHVPERGLGTYVQDMSGGEPKRVNDSRFASSWSLDGRSILLNTPGSGKDADNVDAVQVAMFDVASGKVSPIPGSDGKQGPFQVSSRVIVAKGQQDDLYWFDAGTGKWSVLAEGPVSNWMVSPDSRYLYFVREAPDNPQAMRVRLSDRKIETLTPLTGLRRIADPEIGGSSWIGVAPDGSALFTRDIGTQEIYALAVKWP